MKKLKRYTSYQTRKHLVESLILSKTDYCNVLFKGLSKYHIQRVNKLIQACAGIVKYKYRELKDIAYLNSLLRLLRKNLVMLVHQNKNIKPAYLEEANKVFNDLPNEIREDNYAMSFSMFKNNLRIIYLIKQSQKF